MMPSRMLTILKGKKTVYYLVYRTKYDRMSFSIYICT